jgi:predicted NBD/HSP70 family sugar kinase
MSKEAQSAHSDLPTALGVDLGATTIKAALVGFHGELTESFRQPSPRTPDALHDFVHSVLRRAKTPIHGVGIGCKGIIDGATSRVNRLPGDLHFLEGRFLAEIIDVGDMQVCAENDARTALIGEVLWGAARGLRNVVLLTLGTGVGGAVLVDGKVLRGVSGAAGHLGHMTLDLHGGLCLCGNYGCVETRFSSRAIESDYFAHLHRAASAKLSLDNPNQPPSTEAIFRAAAEGDESARYVLDRAFEYLVAAIVSFLHIFDPELLILGGNIAEAGSQLLAPIREEVARRTRVLLGREVPIVVQSVMGYGGVAGAAGLVFLQQGLLEI